MITDAQQEIAYSASAAMEKKEREYRRREHTIPPEILEASYEDPLVRALTEQYIREGNYVLYLESLAIALYKARVEAQKLMVESYSLRLNPNVIRIEGDAP